jgi:hypothetical protein
MKTYLSMAILVGVLTGCRLGNYTSPPAESQSPWAGLYQAEAKELLLCIEKTQDSEAHCTVANSTATPYEVKQIITNPVGLLVSDDQKVFAFTNPFSSSEQPPMLQTHIDSDGNILFEQISQSIDSITYSDWLPAKYSDCGVQLSVKQEGRISNRDAGKEMYGAPIKGHVEMNLTVRREFVGSGCRDTLYFLQQCFQDQKECFGTNEGMNETRRAEVAYVFELFTENSALDPNEIADVTARAYRVRFE